MKRVVLVEQALEDEPGCSEEPVVPARCVVPALFRVVIVWRPLSSDAWLSAWMGLSLIHISEPTRR
eukprot:656211-Heterocapsa_arctica.AAC.1